MKKTVDFFCWASVVLTILALLCTLVSTYRFGYIKYFNKYTVLQGSIIGTMVLWAYKLYGTGTGKRKWAYSMICLIFALATIYFMRNKVW